MSNSYQGRQHQHLTNTHACNQRKKGCQCFCLLQDSTPEALSKHYYFFRRKIVNHSCLKMLLSVVCVLRLEQSVRPWVLHELDTCAMPNSSQGSAQVGEDTREDAESLVEVGKSTLTGFTLNCSPYLPSKKELQILLKIVNLCYSNVFFQNSGILFWIIYKIHSWIMTLNNEKPVLELL